MRHSLKWVWQDQNDMISTWAAQHSVHPTGGSLRVFRQFAWLEVGSVKMALSRPTHQRVTQTVGQQRIDIRTGKLIIISRL